MTARKFAISLPEELFERLERDRQERRMNRSEYVANAVADHLHRRREKELEEQYVRGYMEHPETEEEVAEVMAWLSIGPELEPWEWGEARSGGPTSLPRLADGPRSSSHATRPMPCARR